MDQNQPTPAGFGNQFNQPGGIVPRPDNHMVKAILVTIFCCLPFGIAAIVNSANVNSRYDAGDPAGAVRASKEANKWSNYGIIAAVAGTVLYLILMFAFGITLFSMGNN